MDKDRKKELSELFTESRKEIQPLLLPEGSSQGVMIDIKKEENWETEEGARKALEEAGNVKFLAFPDAVDEKGQERFEAQFEEMKKEQKAFIIKSVGEEVKFETGAVRDTDEGKCRPDLIHPHFERRMGQHLGDAARPKTEGGKGYGDWNWSKGIPVARSFASLKRHILEYAEGDRAEDHLAAAACNIMFIMCTEEMVRQGLLPRNLLDMKDWKDAGK